MQESVLRVAVFFRSKEFKLLRAELHPKMKWQPAVHDMRVECLQRQLALEQQEQNHALCKQGHYVAEGGGESQLDRAYRMESPQAIETVLCLPKRTTEDAQDVMSVFRSMQELPVEARVSKCRRDHNHYSVPSPKALGTGIQSLAQLTLLLPTTLQHSRLNRNHISTRLRIRQPC